MGRVLFLKYVRLYVYCPQFLGKTRNGGRVITRVLIPDNHPFLPRRQSILDSPRASLRSSSNATSTSIISSHYHTLSLHHLSFHWTHHWSISNMTKTSSTIPTPSDQHAFLLNLPLLLYCDPPSAEGHTQIVHGDGEYLLISFSLLFFSYSHSLHLYIIILYPQFIHEITLWCCSVSFRTVLVSPHSPWKIQDSFTVRMTLFYLHLILPKSTDDSSMSLNSSTKTEDLIWSTNSCR